MPRLWAAAKQSLGTTDTTDFPRKSVGLSRDLAVLAAFQSGNKIEVNDEINHEISQNKSEEVSHSLYSLHSASNCISSMFLLPPDSSGVLFFVLKLRPWSGRLSHHNSCTNHCHDLHTRGVDKINPGESGIQIRCLACGWLWMWMGKTWSHYSVKHHETQVVCL